MINMTHFRIKPLPLTNGHGRCMAATSERALVSVGEWPLHMTVVNLKSFHFRNGFVTAVSLLKTPCGGFRSETATWIQKWFKKALRASIIVIQGGDDERGYRNVCKAPRGRNLNCFRPRGPNNTKNHRKWANQRRGGLKTPIGRFLTTWCGPSRYLGGPGGPKVAEMVTVGT